VGGIIIIISKYQLPLFNSHTDKNTVKKVSTGEEKEGVFVDWE